MNSSEDFQRNENGWQITVIVIPALLSLSTLVIVVVILWKVIRGRSLKGKGTGQQLAGDVIGWAVNEGAEYEDPTGGPLVEKRQLPAEWSIEGRTPLCKGHYGPISWASLVRSREGGDSRPVVLKELSESCSPGEVQDFLDLLKFYEEVCKHRNLVRLLWCQTLRSPACLILEAVTPGNLLHFLRELHQGTPMCSITERDVCVMASQVANGLEYLSGTHNLLHGYVAACNVLLHEDLSVRLCGLGLSAIQHRTGSIPTRKAAAVPAKWQSPERLQGATVTERSDVWAFGILLYELLTLGAPPYPDVLPAQLPQKLQKNYRMTRPPQCGERLYEVMRSCWQWEEPQRPCHTDLLKRLQNYLGEADGSTPLTPTDTLTWPDYLHIAGIPS